MTKYYARWTGSSPFGTIPALPPRDLTQEEFESACEKHTERLVRQFWTTNTETAPTVAQEDD